MNDVDGLLYREKPRPNAFWRRHPHGCPLARICRDLIVDDQDKIGTNRLIPQLNVLPVNKPVIDTCKKDPGLSHGCPILSETHTNGTSATNSTAGQAPDGRRRHHTSNISAFKVRKAVRTLARICDVPYHRQPLTPQLRHHMAASVAQLVEHRSRKAGVTGSSPVAGSIAQDSRLRAAFLLPISSAHPPIQAQRRRQLPYSTTSLANRNPQRNRDQRGSSALLKGITPSDEQFSRAVRYSSQ